MHRILEEYNNNVEYALKVKEYLDSLNEIKDEGFKVTFDDANKAYHISLEIQGVKTSLIFTFRDVYNYLRENEVKFEYIYDNIIDYIVNKTTKLLAVIIK